MHTLVGEDHGLSIALTHRKLLCGSGLPIMSSALDASVGGGEEGWWSGGR